VAQYVEGSSLPMIVQGTAEGARDYLIRVTSAASGAEGDYVLRVESAGAEPVIWSFTPGAGVPGTWVTVRGTNFVDGIQPLFDGVAVGGVGAASLEPQDRGTWQEFSTLVPPDARTGPIALLRNQEPVAQSTNDFIVLAPVGGVRRESGGRLSFGVSNTVAGIRIVVESTPSLSEPVVWTPAATNAVIVPGVWRYTNAPGDAASQKYFRAKTE